ncbi:MAG: hypothetical protein LC713_00485, partial [Actinobacteria bacterium]|nr:hypothetical protein [Actinomycetota bacterium]
MNDRRRGARRVVALGIVLGAITEGLLGGAGVANAAFPGGNGVIAFASAVGSADREIVTLAADGTRTTLTSASDGWSDDGPAFDSTGSRIAFTRINAAADLSEIWVMNADGSGAHQITDDKTRDKQVAWSPDGSQLVYSMRVSAPHKADRFVIATIAVGTTPAAGTTIGTMDAHNPAWSPDGRYLAFESGQHLFMQTVGAATAPVDLGPG